MIPEIQDLLSGQANAMDQASMMKGAPWMAITGTLYYMFRRSLFTLSLGGVLGAVGGAQFPMVNESARGLLQAMGLV